MKFFLINFSCKSIECFYVQNHFKYKTVLLNRVSLKKKKQKLLNSFSQAPQNIHCFTY